MAIEVTKTYSIYLLNSLLDNNKHLSLQRVEFPRERNYFDTEEEAVKTLIKYKEFYDDYLIIPSVRITEFGD